MAICAFALSARHGTRDGAKRQRVQGSVLMACDLFLARSHYQLHGTAFDIPVVVVLSNSYVIQLRGSDHDCNFVEIASLE